MIPRTERMVGDCYETLRKRLETVFVTATIIAPHSRLFAMKIVHSRAFGSVLLAHDVQSSAQA
jgi:hypothetical protein